MQKRALSAGSVTTEPAKTCERRDTCITLCKATKPQIKKRRLYYNETPLMG